MRLHRGLLLLSLLGAILHFACAPAVVNGDGLGYLKAALDGTLYPGHLAYVPLLMLARLLVHAGPHAVAGLVAARVVSAVASAVAAYALGVCAGRVGGARASVLAAAGLLVSWGALAAGSDVESYAPALAALCATLAFATGPHDALHAIATGSCLALAILFHVENVLFGLPVLLILRRHAIIVLGIAALLVGGAYAVVLPAHGAAWLGGASHGLRYPLRLTTPAIALYGACKALVYSPYPYEASWTRVLGQFAVGALLFGVILSSLRGSKPALPRVVILAWLIPYSIVGFAFYASDAERWTFLLPLLWLLASTTPHPRRLASAIAGLALANAILWLPIARDDSLRLQAQKAATHLREGDLVVGPGHGWDEYIGFYEGPQVRAFPLVYFAGALGSRDRLRAAIADAAAQAPRVFVARFADDADPDGWKELVQFGITRQNARDLLPAGNLLDAGDGLQQLR